MLEKYFISQLLRILVELTFNNKSITKCNALFNSDIKDNWVKLTISPHLIIREKYRISTPPIYILWAKGKK